MYLSKRSLYNKRHTSIFSSEMIDVDDLISELDLGDYGEYVKHYQNGPLKDEDFDTIFGEIAEQNTDFDLRRMEDFCRDNEEYIDRGAEALDWPDDVSEMDYDELCDEASEVVEVAQIMSIEDDLDERREDIKLDIAYNYILKDLDKEQVSKEFVKKLKKELHGRYKYENIKDIKDAVDNLID